MKIETSRDRIRIAVTLEGQPAEAWPLITENRHLAHWWGQQVRLDPRLGGDFIEHWSDGDRQVVTSGSITRWEPPLALSLTWADDDWPAFTLVGFLLSPRRQGTRLTMEHTGWAAQDPNRRTTLIDAHARGWSQYLTQLMEYSGKVGR